MSNYHLLVIFVIVLIFFSMLPTPVAASEVPIPEIKRDIDKTYSILRLVFVDTENKSVVGGGSTFTSEDTDTKQLAYYNAKSLSTIDFDPFPPFLSLSMAYEHLYEKMNEFHASFDVYTDLSAAGNHLPMLAQTGEDAEINLGCYENPHSGATCIENKFKFKGTGTDWGGWYFMNGMLEREETQPKANWGEYPLMHGLSWL